MLKALKSYWAFTSGGYKLVMLVVVPIMFVVLNVFLSAQEYGDGLSSLMLLYVIDTMSDIFFMGGMYRKGNSSLEFLQSSAKFSRVIRDITIVDIIRRIFIYQIPFVVTLICSIGNAEKLAWCAMDAFWPWLEILVAQVVVLIARHFVMWNQVYACVLFGFGTLSLSFLMLKLSTLSPVVINVVLVVFILIIATATIWYSDKKVRESYYDK